MKTIITEFPKHPWPPVPEPPRTSRLPPTPVVYERGQWEYNVVERKLAEGLPTADELNALGKQGWELTGVVSIADAVQFYFKRIRA
jgi:hypothetical protein